MKALIGGLISLLLLASPVFAGQIDHRFARPEFFKLAACYSPDYFGQDWRHEYTVVVPPEVARQSFGIMTGTVTIEIFDLTPLDNTQEEQLASSVFLNNCYIESVNNYKMTPREEIQKQIAAVIAEGGEVKMYFYPPVVEEPVVEE